MPQEQLCFYCYQEIDPFSPDIVVVKEAETGKPAQYAHSKCFEKARSTPIETE